MNKKLIIYISCGIIVALVIGISIYFILKNKSSNNSNSIYSTEKVIIEKYEADETIKSIEITKKEQVKELIKICNNVSLEQDEESQYLAIKNDVKIDLNNGIFFFLQLDLSDYCYIENSESNIKAVIKMPEGLLEYVNKVLQEN